MTLGKNSIIVIVSLIINTISLTARARSVYVISNTETPDLTSIIQAYDIQDGSLVYQEAQYESDRWGAVGLAIDTESEFIFVTYEGTPKIELINAKTM